MLRHVALVGTDVSERSNMLQLLVTANVVPSSPIFVALMMVILSSRTSVLTRASRRHIQGDDILHITALKT
jgi:hypothetical protein